MARLIYRLHGLLEALLRVPVIRLVIPRRFRSLRLSFSPSRGSIESGEFYAPSPAVVSRCQELQTPFVAPDPEQFPAVTWSVWANAAVTNNRFFPYLVDPSQVMIQPRRVPGPWRLSYRHNRLLWSNGRRALVDIGQGPRMSIERGIFLGGRDFGNWYHWLIDGLPQLHLANRLPAHYRDWPVLIPEQIFRYPSMVDALELFRHGRDMIVVPEWTMVEAQKLIWIDALELTNLPQRPPPASPDPRIHLLQREGMESYRDVYLDAFASDVTRHDRKIMLVRDGSRRSYNQDEAIAVAEEFGFEPWSPETLSLAEQVRLFRESKWVLGPSGAAFAGLLFSQPGTSALCWQDTRIRSMTILPDLATLNHSDYWHIYYQSDQSGGLFRSNYHLDRSWLRDQISHWLDSTPAR